MAKALALSIMAKVLALSLRAYSFVIFNLMIGESIFALRHNSNRNNHDDEQLF